MADGQAPAAVANDWQDVAQPNDWQDVSATQHAQAGFPTAQGAPAPVPGFLSRAAEATGIPTSMDQLKQTMPQPTWADAIGGPAVTAGKQILNYGKDLSNAATAPIPPEDAARYAGHPYSEIPDVASKFLLEHVLAPVGGKGVSNISTDISNKNFGAAGGDVAGTLLNLLTLGKAAGPNTEGKIAYATRGTAQDVMKAVPDLRAEVLKNGRPKDLNGLVDTIDNAKSNLNGQYANALGPYARQQIMPSGVVDRLQKLLTSNLPNTTWGAAQEKQIKNAIVEFQKPWTLGQLDQERIDANSRTHAFNNKEDVPQYAALRGGNRNVAIDNAIANGIRDTVYPQMDALTGKPKGYFADIKDRIGSLMNLESDAKANRDKLRDRSLAAEGAPFMERHGAHGIVNSEGRPHFYFSNFLTSSDPLATAGKTAAGAFAGPGTSAARAAALVEALRRNAPNHPLLNAPQQ